MSNIVKVMIAVILALTIALLGNGLIWWGLGSLFIWAFEIPYVWSFAKGFVIGLILLMASPVKIKFNTEDLIKGLFDNEGDGDLD